MNLTEFIDALIDMANTKGVPASEVEVVLWEGDDITPVTGIEYDRFEEDGPWTVEIRKAGDP